ncbi:hypothetical protein MHI24_27585 [Paenibacillus sp. FSL K6-1096]|uniref:hypothetical protein n=1 Tax=Paenibacillus sp. FSL K6-1096 TaxID=2921460 RepID=UPI0030EF1BFE
MYDSFCFTDNISHYLNLMGIPVPPVVLFGLAEVMGTTCNRNKEQKFERFNGRNGSHQEMLKRYSEASGIAFSVCNSAKPTKEIPCLIEMDDYYIDYHPFYMKNHYLRLVVLLCIHDDYYEIYDTHHRKISKTTYAPALLKNSIKYIASEGADYEKTGLTQHLTAIQNTCTFNLNNQCKDQIYTGYKGVQLFLEDLEQELKENELEFSQVTYDLFFQILRPGGMRDSREMFARYLHWVNQQYSLPELDQNANGIAGLATKWETVANLFYKASIVGDTNYLTNKVFKLINQVVDEEKEQVEKLLLYIMSQRRRAYE